MCHSIGTGIIGGMIGETTLAMMYVPLLFYLFDRFGEGAREKASPPHADLSAAKDTGTPGQTEEN